MILKVEQCNCENLYCNHGDSRCNNIADARYRVEDLGPVCKVCYDNMPDRYRLPIRKQNPIPEFKRPIWLTHSGIVAYDIFVALLLRHNLIPNQLGRPLFDYRELSDPLFVIALNVKRMYWSDKDFTILLDETSGFRLELRSWLSANNFYIHEDGYRLIVTTRGDVSQYRSSVKKDEEESVFYPEGEKQLYEYDNLTADQVDAIVGSYDDEEDQAAIRKDLWLHGKKSKYYDDGNYAEDENGVKYLYGQKIPAPSDNDDDIL